jgi:hypothetical protein
MKRRWWMVLACLCPVVAFAQRPDSTAVLLVAVTDTLGYPLSGVDVIVTRTVGTGSYLGRTNNNGIVRLEVDRTNEPLMIVARGIGFARKTASLKLASKDPSTILLEMSALSAKELAAVRVEARQSQSFLDSSLIAKSDRLIVDTFDALIKLRPYMLGDPDKCPDHPKVENVWVNGRRVWWNGGSGLPAGVRAIGGSAGQRVEPGDVSGDRGSPLEGILRTIKAEHLAEVRYVNCWDTSLEVTGSDNAVYIILKNGIDWDWANGSHPMKPKDR